MNNKNIYFCLALVSMIIVAGCSSSVDTMEPPAETEDQSPGLDTLSTVVASISINGVPYAHGTGNPVQLITDAIFQFKVVLKNNGLSTWRRDEVK